MIIRLSRLLAKMVFSLLIILKKLYLVEIMCTIQGSSTWYGLK